jgi:hypothetical protein
METVPITTGSGIFKGNVRLVWVSEPVLRKTHNRTTLFWYRTGKDASGVLYETKSRGNGWRKVRRHEDDG